MRTCGFQGMRDVELMCGGDGESLVGGEDIHDMNHGVGAQRSIGILATRIFEKTYAVIWER
jgi:hypothetical protein